MYKSYKGNILTLSQPNTRRKVSLKEWTTTTNYINPQTRRPNHLAFLSFLWTSRVKLRTRNAYTNRGYEQISIVVTGCVRLTKTNIIN